MQGQGTETSEAGGHVAIVLHPGGPGEEEKGRNGKRVKVKEVIVQQRVQEAERSRRESSLWIIAVCLRG